MKAHTTDTFAWNFLKRPGKAEESKFVRAYVHKLEDLTWR